MCTGTRLVTWGNGKCHIILKSRGSSDSLAILILVYGGEKNQERLWLTKKIKSERFPLGRES